MTAVLRSLATMPPRVWLGAAVIAGALLVATLVAWVVAGPQVIALLDRATTAPAGGPDGAPAASSSGPQAG